jgi:UDP-N-acetyl-D-mannosaminuronic acid dehydrogenase
MKRTCVIGLGYIGLPTSIVAAYNGHSVIGYDVDSDRVAKINAGDPVIEEPTIATKLKSILKTGNFYATTTIELADYFIIAVPTPFKEDKSADLSYVFAAAKSIATVIKYGNTVILESTVSVGTTEKLGHMLEQETGLKAGTDFFVAHCPERVLPGKIFEELVSNARIIGGINQVSVDYAVGFYKQFVQGPLYLTDAKTAEMVKLIENSSRDVQIAFANQVAAIAYELGLNPFEVIELANKHPRVNILNPSCGVGGHCLAVDPWFLIASFPEQTKLLKAARQINDLKPAEVIASVREHVNIWKKNHTKVCTVLTLGLTYKQDTDDTRESPALHITHALKQFNDIELITHEPYLTKKHITDQLNLSSVTLEEGIRKADIIVCLVKHTVFKNLSKNMLAHKKIIDVCGILYEPHTDDEQSQEKMFWPSSNSNYVMLKKTSEHKGHA